MKKIKNKEKIKNIIIAFISLVSLVFLIWSIILDPYSFDLNIDNLLNNGLKLSSEAFYMDRNIPIQYTCDDKDINPPLEISGVSKESESLVLVMEDEDSSPINFLHWMIWNINPETKKIDIDSVPISSEIGENDFGNKSYNGPCPEEGLHRYVLRLYSLDSRLILKKDITRKELQEKIENHVIDKAKLSGFYRK